MTFYAEVQGTTLIQYPYGLAQLQAENPETNFTGLDPIAIFPQTQTAIANGYTLAPVTVAAPPVVNPLTQTLVQDALPTLISGVWTLGWTVVALSQAQQAVAQALAGQQAFNTAVAAGVAVTSTSTPAINGTYSCDATSQGLMTAEAVYIAESTALGSATFTNGSTTKPWADAAGALHTFTTTQFLTFAMATARYVDAVTTAVQTGAELPSNTVTIS